MEHHGYHYSKTFHIRKMFTCGIRDMVHMENHISANIMARAFNSKGSYGGLELFFLHFVAHKRNEYIDLSI